MGRDGIEPSTSGLKVQPSHQQAHPTTCGHNDLLVRGRAAWWRFEAASVPKVCQIICPEAAQLCLPGREFSAELLVPRWLRSLCLQEGKLTPLRQGRMIRSTLETIELAESHRVAIQTLSERSQSPFALVEKMYRNELTQLEPHARIRRYLPLV